MMNIEDIIEFYTTWNNEFFFKNKSKYLTAKYLIKKSIIIVQTRLCRQLKYTENDLIKELKNLQNERQILSNYCQSNTLSEELQQRLKLLQNKIDNYNFQIKNIVKKEKEYWKQLEQIIAKRTNLHKITTNKLISSNITQPIVVVNATFVMHIDKNNENIPPSNEIENKSPIKIPKIRKKNKYIS